MKKYYYSMLAASMMLAATSCSQEEDFVQNSSSEMASFEINLEGASSSRAAGDGLTATKLYYEVYQGERKVIDKTADLTSGKATIDMPLLRGEKYDIMFWAQAPTGSIYNPEDLQNITVAYDNATANNEAYDAFFYGEADFKVVDNVTKIELRRPFAQLNIGTTEADWNQAIEMIDGTNKPVTISTVTVTGLATAFNVLEGEASGSEDVTFAEADLLKNEQGEFQTFRAKDVSIYYSLAMNYLLVPGKATSKSGDEVKSTTNVTATFWRGTQELFSYENIVNVPIQRNWRTNILGNLLADYKTFEIEIVPDFVNDYEKTLGTASNSEELKTLLKQDAEYIVIDLAKVEGRAAKEYTVAVGAWTEKYYFGSAKTKSITINANGNTINFVHENTDWNYIRCVNDAAKWIINDAHLTNSGKNNGPWNRHDIRFYNAVELNNVTSDKAIALLNDGKLNKVEITEDGDVYALWITAAGQTVDINGLDITSAGRGIAIKDEYVDNKAKVTLNVKNAKFNTQKKAAILVASTAGADITLENLDLSNVKADKINAVWVDNGDAYKNIDDITVNGGFSKVEEEKATAENNPFLVENATVKVAKGIYGALPTMANGVTIEAEEGTVFTGTSSVSADNVTIKNITFKGTDKALTNGLKNVIFENCHFVATEAVRNCYANGNVVFNDCTFGDENCVRGVHFDAGEGTVTFNRCKLYGFQALGSSIKKLTFNDCEFPYNNNHNVVNMYSVFEYNNCKFNPEMFTDCAVNNVKASYTNCEYTNGKSIYSLVRFDKDPATCTITFNGEQMNFVKDAAGLTKALTDKAPVIALLPGVTYEGTFKVVNDVTIKSADAGNKATIKGRVNIPAIDGVAKFENIKFEINDASTKKEDGNDSFIQDKTARNLYQYPAVIMVYAAAATLEGCEFTDLYNTHNVVAVNYGAHAVGKMLTINNCKFQGYAYAIRSRALVSVTNSEFSLTHSTANPRAVWVWGLGDSTNGKVVFANNKSTDKTIYALQMTSKNHPYSNIEFNVQGNTNLVENPFMINETTCTYSNNSFAEGSLTF